MSTPTPLEQLLRWLAAAAHAMNRHDGVFCEQVAVQRRERRSAARARLAPARQH